MKKITSIIYKIRYFLYTLLTCVLFVGCGNVDESINKQILLDSLEVEFLKQDSLCKYYQTKYNGYSKIDTFWYYSTKCGKCIDKMIILNMEMVRVRDGHIR